MGKSVTLRLNDEVYKAFLEAAHVENRSLSNLIETAAFAKIREQQFADDSELAEILANQDLMDTLFCLGHLNSCTFGFVSHFEFRAWNLDQSFLAEPLNFDLAQRTMISMRMSGSSL